MQYYFIREYVPKGTSFAEWKRLFAVFLQQSPQLTLNQFTMNLSVSGGQFAARLIIRPESLTLTDSGIQMLIFYLDSPKGSAKYGYRPGVDEITAMALYKADTTLVKIYQHWRGAKFDINDLKSWPVGNELSSVVKRFAGIEVVLSGGSN